MRLKGKVMAITGAAGNIGAATARRLAREGGVIALLDRDLAGAEAVRDELANDPETAGPHVALAVDVADPASVREAMEAARAACGLLHLVFANAGIEGPIAKIRDYPDDGFRKVVAIMIEGVFYTVKYGEMNMADGGSIVVTSSLFGIRGSDTSIGYTTAKHAVLGIMKSAAKAYAHRGIRANSIHPGMVKSDMVRRILEARGTGLTIDDLMVNVPIKEYVTPDRIADTLYYLASDDSRVVTGQQIAIDGGWLL